MDSNNAASADIGVLRAGLLVRVQLCADFLSGLSILEQQSARALIGCLLGIPSLGYKIVDLRGETLRQLFIRLYDIVRQLNELPPDDYAAAREQAATLLGPWNCYVPCATNSVKDEAHTDGGLTLFGCLHQLTGNLSSLERQRLFLQLDGINDALGSRGLASDAQSVPNRSTDERG